MRPTSGRLLLVGGLVAAVVGFVVPASAYGSLPPLPWTGPALLALAAGLLTAVAVVLPRRLRGGRDASGVPIRPVEPMAVARWAALAKASSLGGALAAGGYTGFGVYTSLRVGVLDAAARDTTVAGLGLVTGVVLVLAALRLESVCRARPPSDGDGGPA